MTKKELQEYFAECIGVEVFQYSDKTHRLHSDFITAIASYADCADPLDYLPYDKDGEVDVHCEIMNAEEYDDTINANSCATAEDWMEEGDKVGIVVVRDHTRVFDEKTMKWDQVEEETDCYEGENPLLKHGLPDYMQ